MAMDHATAVIRMHGVSKWYGAGQVLDDCSISVGKGEVVAICGPSGSGKSTLIKTINGLEPFQQGEIHVGGMRVGDPRTNMARLRAMAGMVFQQFELFPHLTVVRNLCLAQAKVLKRDRATSLARASAFLACVGLSGYEDKYPGTLSGGQQQRVAIARALAMDPEVLLLDEPTSALDPEMANEVLEVISGLARDGMTMMVVTHELAFARHAATRMVFMDGGQIIEDCPTAAFFDASSPRSDRARRFLERVLPASPAPRSRGQRNRPAEQEGPYHGTADRFAQ